ncbi:MAG: hypothetical protein DRP87_18675 [Spirochaetes bacterium]|nr:MAG: hypothetical protein DRP87_18675 [Spirochaetota bacterium]
MKPTEQQHNLFGCHISSTGGNGSSSLQISEVPLLFQEEAEKFLCFTEMFLNRLNSITKELCNEYLEELRFRPPSYDSVSLYHIALLARRIRKEVDTLSESLSVSSIEYIEMWYKEHRGH